MRKHKNQFNATKWQYEIFSNQRPQHWLQWEEKSWTSKHSQILNNCPSSYDRRDSGEIAIVQISKSKAIEMLWEYSEEERNTKCIAVVVVVDVEIINTSQHDSILLSLFLRDIYVHLREPKATYCVVCIYYECSSGDCACARAALHTQPTSAYLQSICFSLLFSVVCRMHLMLQWFGHIKITSWVCLRLVISANGRMFCHSNQRAHYTCRAEQVTKISKIKNSSIVQVEIVNLCSHNILFGERFMIVLILSLHMSFKLMLCKRLRELQHRNDTMPLEWFAHFMFVLLLLFDNLFDNHTSTWM